MSSIFRVVKNSFFKSLKGKESLKVIILYWGVLVYILTMLMTGFASMAVFGIDWDMLDKSNQSPVSVWIAKFFISIPGPFGLVFSGVYPFLFAYSLIKSSSQDFSKKCIAYPAIILFFYVHFILLSFFMYPMLRGVICGSGMIAFGSIVLLMLSPYGWFFGLAVLIYIAIKVIKGLRAYKL